MQARALLILGLALLLGGITVVLVNRYLQQQVIERQEGQVVKTVSVVVAAADLKTGTRLERVMLKRVDWPAESVPEGVFSSVDKALGEKPPIVLSEIKRGEAILKHRLSPYGARGGLPARIPEDMRAITIPVTEVRGVGGFVMPGDYVDVLHTTSLGRVDKRPVTRLMLQNAQVLGIDQISSTDETEPRIVNAVTLLVSPFDGQRVALAIATGDISLLLRNEFDASLVQGSVASYDDLLTDEPDRKTVVTRRLRRPSVEVIRGLEITNQTVKEGEPATQTGDTNTPAEAEAE